MKSCMKHDHVIPKIGLVPVSSFEGWPSTELLEEGEERRLPPGLDAA